MGSAKAGRVITHQTKMDSLTQTPSSPVFAQNFPNLYKFLEIRERGDNMFTSASMSIFVEDGLVKVCLNDRVRERYVFTTSRELAEALRFADRGLGNGNLNWRSKAWSAAKQNTAVLA